MDGSLAIGLLRKHRAEFESLGVETLFLFGSIARDEADEASDVDLFFDHARGAMSLFTLMDVTDLARRVLGRDVDMMSRRSLHPVLKASIESSSRRVF